MIEIKGLGKSYGPKKVLEKVNLSVPDASVFGLVGINGAGKTTLLRMMADVLRPDEGTVEYDGETIAGNAKKRKELFFLPDDPYYAAGTTVEKLVELYKSFYSFDDELFSPLRKTLFARTPHARPQFLQGHEAAGIRGARARMQAQISSLRRGVRRARPPGAPRTQAGHHRAGGDDRRHLQPLICASSKTSARALRSSTAAPSRTRATFRRRSGRVRKFQAAFDERGPARATSPSSASHFRERRGAWCASSSAAGATRSSCGRSKALSIPSLWKRSGWTLKSSSSAKSRAGGTCHEKGSLVRSQAQSSAARHLSRRSPSSSGSSYTMHGGASRMAPGSARSSAATIPASACYAVLLCVLCTVVARACSFPTA